MREWVPVTLYGLVALALVGQGVRYLFATQLMPYHQAVIETPWQELAPSYQRLFSGLLYGFGAGCLCVGAILACLVLGPLRQGDARARWAIPMIAGGYTLALLYVTEFALLPGATPITVSAVLLGMVVVAAACSCFRRAPSN